MIHRVRILELWNEILYIWRMIPDTTTKYQPIQSPHFTAYIPTTTSTCKHSDDVIRLYCQCADTGLPCDGATSTCNGRNELCWSSGPGHEGDMYESARIIGSKQFEHSLSLLRRGGRQESRAPVVSGGDEIFADPRRGVGVGRAARATRPHRRRAADELDSFEFPSDSVLSYRHSFVHMPSLNVSTSSSSSDRVRLCRAALGYSFAAGTTDGPGQFDFKQHTTEGNKFWDVIRTFISNPTKEDKKCHFPKPILLNTGAMTVPYAWQPDTIPMQLLRLHNFVIAAVPSELSTMAGRRLRRALEDVYRSYLGYEVHVTIAGLSNSYSGYVVTEEEYQVGGGHVAGRSVDVLSSFQTPSTATTVLKYSNREHAHAVATL